MNNLMIIDECIYKIERPLNVSKIQDDLAEISKLLLPGRFEVNQFQKFIEELDLYRIRCDTPEDICAEFVMCLYKDLNAIPASEDIVDAIMDFNYMLEMCMADAVLCINLANGKITSREYEDDYDSLMDSIAEEFSYDFYYYGYSIENLITEYFYKNSLYVDADSLFNYFYSEGVQCTAEFVNAMNEFTKDKGKILLNDCQEILIEDLAEYGCVQIDSKTAGIDISKIKKKEEVKMIGGN